MTAFAVWLRAHMEERHWSRSKTASLCHVDGITLAHWLTGLNLPSFGNIRKVAWAFDVSELEVYCLVRGVSDDELRAELARRGGSDDNG
jgi:transcriptional regulator with XRE-family HTH domain